MSAPVTEPAPPSLPELPPARAASGRGLPLPGGLLRQALARAEAGSGQGTYGDSSGTTQRMGALQFDPQGADFTLWIQRFKDEVYRNWVIPQAAMWGWGGEVSFEFVVERDGRISALRPLSGSGTKALDRAAENALVAAQLLPLPSDYAPPSVTMRVVFVYGPPGPQAARR